MKRFLYALTITLACFAQSNFAMQKDKNNKDVEGKTALSIAIARAELKVIETIISNKFHHPSLYYGKDNGMHVLQLAKNPEPFVYNTHFHPFEIQKLDKERRQKYQRIGKALIIFEGFYTGRNLIAKKGFAQILPMEIAKYMAAHFDYKSILLASEYPTWDQAIQSPSSLYKLSGIHGIEP